MLMKERIKNLLKGIGVVVCVVGLAVGAAVLTTNSMNKNSGLTDYNYMIYRDRIELAMEGCRDRIVTEIEHYIDSVAEESGLNGIKLFEKCEKYGIDVRFAMAQGQAESNFGTTGMAAKTNVVWNVRAYDNTTAEEMKRKGHTYKHPDESIEPYLRLLTNKYLVDDKDEFDMFDNFVDVDGHRYASNEKYENVVKNIYDRINRDTKLDDLLKEYRKYQRRLAFGIY